MRMRTKLMIIPIISAIFFFILLFTVYLGLANQKRALDNIYKIRFQGYKTCSEIYEDILGYHLNLYKLLSWSASGYDPEKIAQLNKTERETISRVALGIEKASQLAGLDENEKTLYVKSIAVLKEYQDWSGRVLDIADADLSIANMFMGTADDKMTALRDVFAALQSAEKALGEEAYDAAAKNSEFTLVLTVAIFAVSMALSVIVSLLLSRRIMRSLDALGKRAKDISKGSGDLTQEINIGSSDEIGELGVSFSEFIQKLEGIIGHLKQVSENSREIGGNLSRIAVDTSTDTREISETINSSKDSIRKLDSEIRSSLGIVKQIAAYIEQMSGSIENQSTAVSESSASIEEMAASIATITSIVEQKKALSDTLSATAQEGLRKMGMSSDAIAKMNHSADAVVKSVDVINRITKNLNLLAMNAAIEAAHAGEAGRGFAVVAQEVRSLAEDTAKNAKSISQTLKGTVKDMQTANQLNQDTKTSLGQLATGIQEIVNAMEETRSGLNELSASSREIVKAVASLLELTESIRDRSTGINENAVSIDANMNRVSGLSSQATQGMEEITAAVYHVSETMTKLSEIGKANEESVTAIDQELQKFRTRG
jgi:methyl-accepting chemotaxis protein